MLAGLAAKGKAIQLAAKVDRPGDRLSIADWRRGRGTVGALEAERVDADIVAGIVTREDGIRAVGIERTDGIDPRTERAVGAELGPVGPIDLEQRGQIAGRGGHAHQNMLAGLAAKGKGVQLAGQVNRAGHSFAIAGRHRGGRIVGALHVKRIVPGVFLALVLNNNRIGASAIQ